MQETEQVIQAYTLTIILTIMSVFDSSHPYLGILFSGLLFILFTVRSLTEEPGRLLFAVQLCLSGAFVILSGNAFSCLIFYECRILKCRWFQIFWPSLAWCLIRLAAKDLPLPQVIGLCLVLGGSSGVIFLVESLALRYLSARHKNDRAVSIAAVNEMYEKKLNRELVIKNYLTDKNARLEERETISRNIHNSVGHSITAAIMALDAADLLFEAEPNRAREKMNTANRRIRSSLESIRHAVRVLDGDGEILPVGDLVQQLNGLTESFAADAFIRIRSDFGQLPVGLTLSREHVEFLTGAVQELLSNGVRHGGADLFTLRLAGDSGHIYLSLLDNGHSDFSPENQEERIQNGFGLKKLMAYTVRCGGKAVFGNENGFRAELTLPLIEEGGEK